MYKNQESNPQFCKLISVLGMRKLQKKQWGLLKRYAM